MRDAVIVDMDGTLANVSSIRHHVRTAPKDFDAFHADSVNVPPHDWVVDLLRTQRGLGRDIVVVTARRSRWRHHTAWWLAIHDVPSDALVMRADADGRRDVDVKRDILNDWIRPVWRPVLAVDDNPAIVALWREEGIPTLVVPGWETDVA